MTEMIKTFIRCSSCNYPLKSNLVPILKPKQEKDTPLPFTLKQYFIEMTNAGYYSDNEEKRIDIKETFLNYELPVHHIKSLPFKIKKRRKKQPNRILTQIQKKKSIQNW